MAADRTLELALRIRTLVQDTDNIDDLRQGMDGLADDLEQAGQQADQAGNQLDDIEESGRKAGEGAKEASSGMSDLVEGIKAFMTLAAAKEIIDLNDRLATLKRGFEAATGSQQGAAEALNFVRTVADRLGVSVFDLSQSYLKMTAAAKGTQLEGKATEQIFSSLAGAMSIVGASADDVDNAMNAVAQMMSKGVISAEELRGQLGDVLPGAAQQAAQALLVTNAEFNKMLESGEVIASEFLPKFATQLEQAMGGSGKQVETFSAAVARMQNRLIDLATGEVGQALTRFATVLVNALEPALRGLEAVETLTGAVGRAIGGLAAGEVSSALDDFGQSVSQAALNLIGLKSEAQQAAERQKQMAEEAKTTTTAIDALQNAVARGELKDLPENLQAAIAEFKKTGDAAAATEQAISKFMAAPAQNLNLDGILNLATSIKAVAQDAKGAGDQIASTLGTQLAKLTNEQLVKLEEQARKAMAAAGDNEAARKAFADLGQVIEGVVLARFERLGVDGKEALTGLSDAANDAIDDFAAIASNAEISGDAIEKAFEGALAKLDSPEELEKLKQKIIDLGNDGKLTGEQVERAMLLIRQRAQETANDTAFKALADQLAKIREEADRETEASARAITLKQAQIEAVKRLADAKGDEAAAAQAVADAAELEVTTSRERTDQIAQEIDLTKQHIQQLYARANADGQYSDAEREVIEALKDKVAQLDLERQKIEANLPLQERQAQQAAILAGPIGDLARLYAKQAKEHERAADASEQYYSVQLKEIEGAIRVAKAKGDEAEVSKLQAKQQQILIDQAEALATAKATEAADAQKAVDAKKLELAADGELSKADQEQIANLQAVADQKKTAAQEAELHAEALQKEVSASQETTKATEEQDKANKKASESSEKLATMVAASATQLMKLSAGTREMVQAQLGQFDAITRTSGLTSEALEKLKNGLASADHAIKHNATTAGMLTGAWIKNYDAANNTWKAYYEQAIAAEELTLKLERMMQSQAMNEDLVREVSDAATHSLGLLDKASLDRLQGAIDEAKDKLQALQDEAIEARDRIAELDAEIAKESGNEDVSEKMQLELDRAQALREAEAALAKARAEDNKALIAAYEEQVRKLQTLYDLKEKNLEQTQREREQKREEGTTTTHTTTTSGSSGIGGGGGSTISPSFHFPNAIVVDRRAVEELTRQHILPVLKDIERRTR